MAIAAAQQIDANSRTINSNEAMLSESTWTFAAATTGAVAAHTVFTVTGNVLVSVFGVCDTTLDSGGAPTIEMGVTGNTAALIAQSVGKSLADGEVWVDATMTRVGVGAIPSMQVLNDGNDIILTIASATVTAGVIDFYCLWRPLSSDGNITVTTPA
ncbi:MAG: hypothetical protein NUV65_03010 [Candidatus Roizmanbacteria bacterium]|nr:hypothetical protein [Candidatus Roizmanbacteria bacterium]